MKTIAFYKSLPTNKTAVKTYKAALKLILPSILTASNNVINAPTFINYPKTERKNVLCIGNL